MQLQNKEIKNQYHRLSRWFVISPYKGSLPALESKDSSKVRQPHIIYLLSPLGLFFLIVFYYRLTLLLLVKDFLIKIIFFFVRFSPKLPQHYSCQLILHCFCRIFIEMDNNLIGGLSNLSLCANAVFILIFQFFHKFSFPFFGFLTTKKEVSAIRFYFLLVISYLIFLLRQTGTYLFNTVININFSP